MSGNVCAIRAQAQKLSSGLVLFWSRSCLMTPVENSKLSDERPKYDSVRSNSQWRQAKLREDYAGSPAFCDSVNPVSCNSRNVVMMLNSTGADVLLFRESSVVRVANDYGKHKSLLQMW